VSVLRQTTYNDWLEWKGLINDPHLDQSFKINDGLRLARHLLLDLAEMEVPSGTEFLDLMTPQYLVDLVS
jgi:3-deoxy-7-phosphoheptulonate synthase